MLNEPFASERGTSSLTQKQEKMTGLGKGKDIDKQRKTQAVNSNENNLHMIQIEHLI